VVLRPLLHRGTVVNGDHPDDAVHVHGLPPWCADGGSLVLTGRTLAVAGVQAPPLHPEHLLLVRATAV
jgi:alpha-galactosidase